jgi:hypothetical protein
MPPIAAEALVASDNDNERLAAPSAGRALLRRLRFAVLLVCETVPLIRALAASVLRWPPTLGKCQR